MAVPLAVACYLKAHPLCTVAVACYEGAPHRASARAIASGRRPERAAPDPPHPVLADHPALAGMAGTPHYRPCICTPLRRDTVPLPTSGLGYTESISERLARRLKVTETGCWEWQGCTTRCGYGRIGKGRDGWEATHRVAWKLTHGDTGDLYVLHSCDNPPCCNPDHLFLGTPKDNTQDMMQKGRHRNAKGDAHPSSTLTDAQVGEMRALYPTTVHTFRELGALYGVSKEQARRVVRGLRRPLVPTPRPETALVALIVDCVIGWTTTSGDESW
jgi:hypothetical protein